MGLAVWVRSYCDITQACKVKIGYAVSVRRVVVCVKVIQAYPYLVIGLLKLLASVLYGHRPVFWQSICAA